MNIDQLAQQLAAYDKKLDASIKVNRTSLHGKSRSSLQRLSFSIAMELAINLLGMILLGSFMGDHFSEARFFVPALMLHLFLLGTVIMGVQQLVILRGIDLSRPVLESQRTLRVLQVQRSWILKWTLLLSPLVWTPLLIVGLRGFVGVDAYRALGWEYLAANLIFGLAFIPVAIWVSRKFTSRWPALQDLMDNVAGRNLSAAIRELDEVAKFELD